MHNNWQLIIYELHIFNCIINSFEAGSVLMICHICDILLISGITYIYIPYIASTVTITASHHRLSSPIEVWRWGWWALQSSPLCDLRWPSLVSWLPGTDSVPDSICRCPISTLVFVQAILDIRCSAQNGRGFLWDYNGYCASSAVFESKPLCLALQDHPIIHSCGSLQSSVLKYERANRHKQMLLKLGSDHS